MRGWVNKLKTKGLNCCSDPSIMTIDKCENYTPSAGDQLTRNKVDKISCESQSFASNKKLK